MPLPVAHALVGASIAGLCIERRLRRLAAVAVVAVAPDADFFFVWVLGWGREWHRGPMHSLPLAAACGVIAFAVLGKEKLRYAVALTLALASHGVLDALLTVQGGGVELWWPFSTERFKFALTSLFENDCGSNAVVAVACECALEAVVFLPLFAVVLLLSRGPESSGRR